MRREVLALLAAGMLLVGGVPAWGREPDPGAARIVPVDLGPVEGIFLPLGPDPEPPVEEPQEPDLQTSWGFGPGENLYNETILDAVLTAWPHPRVPLPPALFKSVIATESAFNPKAVSATGAMGLAQLTPDTARRFGLTWSGARDPRQALPVGVQVLGEKARAILEPDRYHELLGRRPEDCPYAARVAEAYQLLGPPSAEESWPLVLAAYNGGGGTVLRAMAFAWDRGLDPRRWENLVGDRSRPKGTPLYAACVQVYRHGAAGKYREMARYPEKVLKYYRSAGTGRPQAGADLGPGQPGGAPLVPR